MSEDAVIIDFPSPPLENAREAIGEVLREERHEQERTLADVAEDAAVSLPYLSEVERGRKDVSTDLLESIAGALELDIAEVFERAARKLRASSARGPQLSLRARPIGGSEHGVDDPVVQSIWRPQNQGSVGVGANLFCATSKVA